MDSLVNYASSSEDEDIPSTKRKATETIEKDAVKMPKLPSFFESSKEPNRLDHQGRTRTVPHQEDSWATYVYCKVDLTDEMKRLSDHLKDLEIFTEPHISLSRPVYLRKFQLDSFVENVKSRLKNVSSFSVSFAQVAMLNNDENTRSFLTLEIGKGYNELFQCMEKVDQTMIKFHKATFYDPPRFHASIAWSLQETTVKNATIPEPIMADIIKSTYLVSSVYIKMGNRLEKIPLK